MKKIASEYFAFSKGNSEMDKYTITFLATTKDCNNGCYTIIDTKGNEHEVGLWERVKDYDFKTERYKNTYIYRACSFKEMERGKSLRSFKYYRLKDVLSNQIYKFMRDEKL